MVKAPRHLRPRASVAMDEDRAPRMETGPSRMTLVVAITAALALATMAASWTGVPGVAFWFWLTACMAGEVMWFRLPAGGATLSMAACFNVAALLVLPVGEAMLATALASLTIETLFMRKPPMRAAYNASHTALSVFAGASVAALAGGIGPGGMGALGAAVLAVLAYYAVNRLAVCCAVALHGGRSLGEAWRENFGGPRELISSGAVFSLGILLAVHQTTFGPLGTLLVALPLLIAFDSYRRLAGGHRAGTVPGRTSDRQAA